MSSQRQLKTSVVFAPEKRVSDSRDPHSTELSPTSCVKEETSPTTTELVENQSTEISSKMKTFNWSIPAQVNFLNPYIRGYFSHYSIVILTYSRTFLISIYLFILIQESSPWPMLVPTPTVRSFSCVPPRHLGWMESTLFSVQLLRAWKLSRRWVKSIK